jgi:hypothetical protein
MLPQNRLYLSATIVPLHDNSANLEEQHNLFSTGISQVLSQTAIDSILPTDSRSYVDSLHQGQHPYTHGGIERRPTVAATIVASSRPISTLWAWPWAKRAIATHIVIRAQAYVETRTKPIRVVAAFLCPLPRSVGTIIHD